MSEKGQILIDKFSGDTFEFLETGSDTHGERVTLKVSPKSKGQTISPAIDVDHFIKNLVGLINDGKVKNGKLPFLQAMVRPMTPKWHIFGHSEMVRSSIFSSM